MNKARDIGLYDETPQLVAELRAALADMEAGNGPGRFVEGHGLQSRAFAFAWESKELKIEFSLPCERLLSDEEDQRLDAARRTAQRRDSGRRRHSGHLAVTFCGVACIQGVGLQNRTR